MSRQGRRNNLSQTSATAAVRPTTGDGRYLLRASAIAVVAAAAPPLLLRAALALLASRPH